MAQRGMDAGKLGNLMNWWAVCRCALDKGILLIQAMNMAVEWKPQQEKAVNETAMVGDKKFTIDPMLDQFEKEMRRIKEFKALRDGRISVCAAVATKGQQKKDEKLNVARDIAN